MQIVGCSQIFLISRTATNLSNFSLVLQWQGHLIKALHSMNAGDLADQALRQIDRAQWAEQDCASKDPCLVNVSDKYYSRTLINNPSILRTNTPPRWIAIPLGSMPRCDWTVMFSEGWSELCGGLCLLCQAELTCLVNVGWEVATGINTTITCISPCGRKTSLEEDDLLKKMETNWWRHRKALVKVCIQLQ